MKDSPFWRVPLVDARTYHDLALRMLDTSWLAPDDPDIHKWLMDAYLEKRDYPNAEKHALECIRLAPSYGPAYATLARIYKAEGKTAKAEEILRTIETYGQSPSWK